MLVTSIFSFFHNVFYSIIESLVTLQEKEKILVTWIFFFSHSVFYSIIENAAYLKDLFFSTIDFQCTLLQVWKFHDCSINPSPNDKFLDVTKLKAFADGKLNVALMAIFLFDRTENTVGKGENAGSHSVFQSLLL